MDDVICLECPNCGGTDFVDVGPRRHRCTYCGTVLKSQPGPAVVTCSHCGAENVQGNSYCSHCGRPLPGKLVMRLKEADPATISLVVTIVGTVLVPVPVLGAGLGLYLGYKALREARAGGWNSEKLARTAVIVGWIGLAYLVLPLCIWLGWLGCAGAASVCEGLWETLFNRLGGIL